MLILKLPLLVPDYKEKRTVLQYALERYTNIDQGQDVPESVIEAFVVKIVVSKDGFDWYLRFDGDPDKPLHCQLQGKRKSSTKILVSPGCSPSMDSSPTGCYQGLIPKNTDPRRVTGGDYFCFRWQSGKFGRFPRRNIPPGGSPGRRNRI